MHAPDSVLLAGTFIPLLSIFFGGLLLLIPVIGITVRHALKPALELVAQLRELQDRTDESRLMARRVELMEQQLQGTSVMKLPDASVARAGDGELGGDTGASLLLLTTR